MDDKLFDQLIESVKEGGEILRRSRHAGEDAMSEYIVVFDLGTYVLVMTDEEEFVERGKKFSTREEALEAIRGHMLASTAYVLPLEDQ